MAKARAEARAVTRERARTPEAKEELRGRILREAMDLFVAEGYRGFSMRKLADRLGYSATMLYAYFRNKDDLLFAIIGQGYELFRTHLAVAGGDPIERLNAVGTAYMDFAFGNPMLYKLMFLQRPGPLFDLSEEAVSRRLGLLRGVAETAREAPALAALDDTSLRHVVELYWAMLHGLVSLALTVPLFDEAWARHNLGFLRRNLRSLLATRGGVRAVRSA